VEYSSSLLIDWSPRHNEVEGDTYSKHLAAIRELCEVYRNDQFVWEGITFNISMDWTQLEEIFIQSEDTNGPYHIVVGDTLYKKITPLKEITIPINLSLSSDVDAGKIQAYLRRYLLDLFIFCNLAAPGIINFFNAKLERDDDYRPMKLSSFTFECALENVFTRQVPFVDYVSIKTSFDWYRSLGIETKIVASNSIEKAIFSLLHIARMSDYDISTVTWIFHALEAIYGTNAGRGFTDISEKVNFLLNIEERQQKRLKRKLRELNDLRSSFVHGGYNVSHIIDCDSNDGIYDIINFGISLIISTLQNLMRNGWKGIHVESKFVGYEI
jgi:hypothetical protein